MFSFLKNVKDQGLEMRSSQVFKKWEPFHLVVYMHLLPSCYIFIKFLILPRLLNYEKKPELSFNIEDVFLAPGTLVLQSFAMFCNVLQCIAMFCNVLQCSAMFCNVLQCFAMFCNVLQFFAMFCNVLQCFAKFCNVLQCFEMFCNVRKIFQA